MDLVATYAPIEYGDLFSGMLLKQTACCKEGVSISERLTAIRRVIVTVSAGIGDGISLKKDHIIGGYLNLSIFRRSLGGRNSPRSAGGERSACQGLSNKHSSAVFHEFQPLSVFFSKIIQLLWQTIAL